MVEELAQSTGASHSDVMDTLDKSLGGETAEQREAREKAARIQEGIEQAAIFKQPAMMKRMLPPRRTRS